jgi:hypothetical protein
MPYVSGREDKLRLQSRAAPRAAISVKGTNERYFIGFENVARWNTQDITGLSWAVFQNGQ